MIIELKTKLIRILDSALERYGRFLPFGGKYLGKVKEVVEANFSYAIVALKTAAEQGDYRAGVAKVVGFLKSAIGVPGYLFWVRPVIDGLIDQIGDYLVAHEDEILGRIIAVPAPGFGTTVSDK